MADRRPSPFDAGDRSPRHLRVDDRPMVRDLDDRQLAVEAVAALRAEHGRAASADLIPFDPAPAAPDGVLADPTSGRHRRDVRLPPSPEERPAGKVRPVDRSGAATAPVAAGHRPPRVEFTPPPSPTPPPVPQPHRRTAAPPSTIAPSEAPAGSNAAADRRSSTSRGVLLWAALVTVVLVALLAVVALVLGGTDDSPASVGPGATPPTADARPSPGPAATTAGASTPDALGSTGPDGTAGLTTERATGAAPSIPPPAVVSTLAPGDAGFGWPSTAFGRPGD